MFVLCSPTGISIVAFFGSCVSVHFTNLNPSFGGIFYNFQELWMAENNLSLRTISIVFSICALLTVSIIFLCSNLIRKEKLKKFTTILLVLKTIILFSFFILNSSGLNILIKFLVMLDYVIDVEIFACIYPMITMIEKNDKLYAKRSLIYSFFYYFGALIAGILLGKTIFNLYFNYNFYALIAAIFSLISTIFLISVKVPEIKSNTKEVDYDAFYRVIDQLKQDKPSFYFLLFIFKKL